MYRDTEEFVDEWTTESNTSLKVMKVITDSALDQKIHQEGRNLAHLAWHMTMMIGGTSSIVGLEVAAPPRGTEMPNSAAALAEVYERAARSLGEQALSKLPDSKLSVEVPYFGRSMPIGRILHGLVLHQCHHRGQMTVLIRQAGLVHPGVYGPTREEAAARAKQ
ncbi:MAG TPA: DinB family protein [Spirochaetia bacterium]|nr:DinB family protein [Spirochaetia bacterium]